MTIRQQFNRTKRRILAVLLVGAAYLFAAMAWAVWLNIDPPWWAIFGFVVMGAAIVFAAVSFRCPNCKNRWGQIAMMSGWKPFSLSIDTRFRYCPFCGCDIDAE
jgi:hypothetical protein